MRETTFRCYPPLPRTMRMPFYCVSWARLYKFNDFTWLGSSWRAYTMHYSEYVTLGLFCTELFSSTTKIYFFFNLFVCLVVGRIWKIMSCWFLRDCYVHSSLISKKIDKRVCFSWKMSYPNFIDFQSYNSCLGLGTAENDEKVNLKKW